MGKAGVSMASIDLGTLERYMCVFGHMMADRSGSEFTSFSGNSYLQEQEGYKYRVLADAQNALAISRWNGDMLAKRGSIGAHAVKAMTLSDNLVDYHQRLHFGNVLASRREEAELALFDIYRSADDETAFEQAINVFGAKYDLIAYLFFLKDGGRYLPVRPRIFDNSFRILGIDLTMNRRCSWKNYRVYLDVIMSIRRHLDDYFGFEEPPTLLDAHSFVWMADNLEAYEAGMSAIECTMPNEPVAKNSIGLTKQRIGQEKFRQALISYWDGECAVTSCSDLRILTSSHIKPWRVCSIDNEWLNPFNGILLSPNLDSLFDAGLISFDDDGMIIISQSLDREDASKLGVNSKMRLKRIDERHKPFLEYHRRNILLK